MFCLTLHTSAHRNLGIINKSWKKTAEGDITDDNCNVEFHYNHITVKSHKVFVLWKCWRSPSSQHWDIFLKAALKRVKAFLVFHFWLLCFIAFLPASMFLTHSGLLELTSLLCGLQVVKDYVTLVYNRFLYFNLKMPLVLDGGDMIFLCCPWILSVHLFENVISEIS